jgi:hypothetical protein
VTSQAPRELRASDADREQVAEMLRIAVGDGRISLEELEDRLQAAYTAKTHSELATVTEDLPDVPSRSARSADLLGGRLTSGRPTSRFGIGIMSGFRRRGTWTVGRRFTAVSFCGGGQIDLLEARFSAPEVLIRAYAIMGGTQIIVPDDVEIDVRGLAIMGGFGHPKGHQTAPGAPRVVVTGFAFWGGVGVMRRPRGTPEAVPE